MLQAPRDPINDLLADPRDRKNQEHDAGKENHAQRRAPRHVHPQADRVREIRVERHARRECDRIVRVQPHYQRGDCRRDARREQHTLDRHAGLAKDLRVHHDDICHRQERGNPAKKLAANGGLVFAEAEVALDHEADILRYSLPARSLTQRETFQFEKLLDGFRFRGKMLPLSNRPATPSGLGIGS